MIGAQCDYSLAGPQLIITFQLLLLRLRHCAKCTCPSGTACSYSPRCAETKELWNHILECVDPACSRPGCQEAVQLLKHHQRCKQQCPICSPCKTIMDLIKNQPREGMIPGKEDWGEESTIIDRMTKLHRTMEVLMHTSACVDPACTYDSCSKVKDLFQHAVECTVRAEGGCSSCRRLWGVLQLHSRQCRLQYCPVPRCQDLRDMAQRRQAFRNARREALELPSSRRKREVGHQRQLEIRMQQFGLDNGNGSDRCC